MKGMEFYDQVAREKAKAAGAPPGWEPFRYESPPPHDDGIIIIEGDVARIAKSGPRKGQHIWPKKVFSLTVVVTKEEADNKRKKWEKETDNCGKCGGSGKETCGWSRDEGVQYRTCNDCGGTGKPK